MPKSKKHNKISPYTLRLVKQNIGYIVAIVFFVLIISVFAPQYVKNYITLRSELKETEAHVIELEKRISVLEQYNVTGLDDLILTLNSLYPAQEDRFSIFNAVDNITNILGVNILASSSPFNNQTTGQISISVNALATETQMRQMLQNHLFKTGRLMTIDSISYEYITGDFNFTSTFYSEPVNLGNEVIKEYSIDAINFAERVKREVESVGLGAREIYDDEDIPTDYGTKTNPFN